MERRKILLGSGTALATVLAGCSSKETGKKKGDTKTDKGKDHKRDNKGEGHKKDKKKKDHEKDKKKDHKHGDKKKDHKHDDDHDHKNGDDHDHDDCPDHDNGNGDDDDGNGDDDDGNGDGSGIPGCDDNAFNIDSDVIHIEKIEFNDGTLELRIMVTTTNRDVLAEELRAFARSFRDGVCDPEEFLGAVEEIELEISDEEGDDVLEVFLDVQWVRDLLNGNMTDQEFANRIMNLIRRAMGQA